MPETLSHLSRLPSGILRLVCDEIQSSSDLLSFALTNKRALASSNLAARKKYRHISIAPEGDYGAAFRTLLETLRLPQLGGYVRHIELNNSLHHGCSSLGPKSEPVSLVPAEIDLLRTAIARAGTSVFRDTEIVLDGILTGLRPYDPFRHRSEDDLPGLELFTALLIAICPRIESLSCPDLGSMLPKYRAGVPDVPFVLGSPSRGAPASGPHHVLTRFLDEIGHSQGRARILCKLRNFSILPDTGAMVPDQTYGEHDFYTSLNAIRRLPSIESVRFEAVQSPTDAIGIKPPPRSANYTKIRLDYCALDTSVLKAIVESAKNLRELVYTSSSRRTLDFSVVTARPQSLLDSLYIHRDTLERLELDYAQQSFSTKIRNRYFIGNDIPEAEMDARSFFLGMRNRESMVFRGDADDRHEDQQDEFELENLAQERLEFECEWADELEQTRTTMLSTEDQPTTARLRDLTRLKHLGLGIAHLYYFSAKDNDDKGSDGSLSLADCLLPNLETLRIFGLDDDNVRSIDSSNPDCSPIRRAISTLRQERTEKLPLLSVIEGIDEPLPSHAAV